MKFLGHRNKVCESVLLFNLLAAEVPGFLQYFYCATIAVHRGDSMDVVIELVKNCNPSIQFSRIGIYDSCVDLRNQIKI